ncbi:MAG: DegT/DnrJ/EryC1/StrS family aminotransferase, partial [Candidatus Taylorbacteria bacterium]|nr:DegT/DnrJ/EryC1/StrS family aminotransferase [Candidatus Taylorbacteria bacterium]
MQAGIGLGELQHIDEYLAHKKWMAAQYDTGLKGIPGIKTPVTKPNVKNAFWVYAILIDPKKFPVNRDGLRKLLAEANIGTRDFFYPPEDQPVLRNIIGNDKFPNSAYAGQNGLYLPSGLTITQEQIDYVIEQIKKIALT